MTTFVICCLTKVLLIIYTVSRITRRTSSYSCWTYVISRKMQDFSELRKTTGDIFRSLSLCNCAIIERRRPQYHSVIVVIVCMIFTTPGNWSTRARAVRVTWATRCPYPVFFYSGSGVDAGHPIRKSPDAVALDVREGRDFLTEKTLAGLRYSLAKYGNVAEWFLKADDDTLVLIFCVWILTV